LPRFSRRDTISILNSFVRPIVEGDLFAERGILSTEQTVALEQSAPTSVGYAISDSEYARAKAIHSARVGEWMHKSRVPGVGIGSSADSPGEAALVIFLIRGVAHDAMPPVIDGVRTRVRESSPCVAGVGHERSKDVGKVQSRPSVRATDPQLLAGGKKIFQNCGEGVLNSIGTSEPSGFICGGRTTCASTFFCVLGFSIASLVPLGRPSARIIVAPLALTVCVTPLIGLVFPGK
jgi:hypothetical protein